MDLCAFERPVSTPELSLPGPSGLPDNSHPTLANNASFRPAEPVAVALARSVGRLGHLMGWRHEVDLTRGTMRFGVKKFAAALIQRGPANPARVAS